MHDTGVNVVGKKVTGEPHQPGVTLALRSMLAASARYSSTGRGPLCFGSAKDRSSHAGHGAKSRHSGAIPEPRIPDAGNVPRAGDNDVATVGANVQTLSELTGTVAHPRWAAG